MASCTCTKTGARKNISKYKGIETLLRRIAFNLGNTPSQTEVKIISCIPIDVTDLQQKILCLEKQLEKTRLKKGSTDSVCSKRKEGFCKRKEKEETICKHRAKNVLPVLVNNVAYHPEDDNRKHNTQDLSLYLHDAQYQIKSATKKSRNVFGQIIPERERTRLVYYAQTSASPFTDYKRVPETNKDEGKPEIMNPDYLSSIIERQHMVKMYMDDEMLGSQGSVPVCRDVPRCSGTSDDMCSCCNGNFLDVDCKLRKRMVYSQNIDYGNVYYDSSLYDVKPVKEKAVKKSETVRTRAPELNFAFYPEYYRFRPEYFTAQNHCAGKPVKVQKKERRPRPVVLPDSSLTDGLVEFSHIYPKRLSPKQGLRLYADKLMSKDAQCNAQSGTNTDHTLLSKPIEILAIKKFTSTSNLNESTVKNPAGTTDNKSATVEVKALQTTSLSHFESAHNNVKVAVRNTGCLAVPMTEIECQTDSSGANVQSTGLSEPNKTESTLNQIKTMLETVLIEVKTNSGVRTTVCGKETKDAIVQNENTSISDCERILNSYTYSPYAITNPYMPSCSHPMPAYCSSTMRQTLTMPRQIQVPPIDVQCLQFPEMVLPTVPHACYPDRNVQPKQTSTCATNTHDPPKKRNTETENLIKEIYKSMKLDVNFAAKPAKPTETKSKTAGKAAGTETARLGREEIVYRGDVGTRRMQTECPSDSSLNSRQRRRGGSFHQAPRHITSSQRRQCVTKGTNKETPESVTESESVTEVETATTSQQPVKKGFFGKVMSSVVKRMRKKEEEQPQKEQRTVVANEVTHESESSDFEAPAQRDRPVKHVSYAPHEDQRPRTSSSKTRRLGQARRPERGAHPPPPPPPPPRLPRYVPRSVLRPHAGSSQLRRAAHRPHQPQGPGPRTPPDYVRRVPHHQHDWRTTPARSSAHRMRPVSTIQNDYKPKVPARSPGLKITNKSWMRKPVYHLGFACGPEKEKIMMQY